MHETFLTKEYWNNRYENGNTGWDLRTISPPLKAYFDQLVDKNIAILIPGCGNAHEAAYLAEKGFTNITLIDIAPKIVAVLSVQFSGNPAIKVICGDFFNHQGQYYLIVEQTFFCAIDPILRVNYAQKMKELLTPQGKLIGLLFKVTFPNNPPFGGNKEEYAPLLASRFDIITLTDCYNSAQPRVGTELFFQVRKPKIEYLK